MRLKRGHVVIGFWSATVLGMAALTAAVLVALRSPQPSGASSAPSGQPVLGFVRVSRPAPAFELPALDGHGRLGPRQLAGKPIVVNFWSSTCTECQQESPAIAQVAQAVRGRVTFLGVDTIDSRGSALAFAAHYRLSYPLAYDPQGVAANAYRVPGLPMTVFLSPSGTRILGINLGALTARGLTGMLAKLYGV